MIRRMFLLMLGGACVALGVPLPAFSEDGVIPGFDEALAAGTPILLHITAEWCPICRTQKPLVSSMLYTAEFKRIKKFEVDFDTRKDVLARFHVQTQSTMIVFKDGKEVDRQAGQTDPKVIEALLREAL